LGPELGVSYGAPIMEASPSMKKATGNLSVGGEKKSLPVAIPATGYAAGHRYPHLGCFPY
jgi:hypothetical protein